MRAVVIGKFMPLHLGHLALIQFAQEYADEVVVVVDCVAGESPSAAERAKWVQESAGNVTVVALTEPTPQQPDEHPDFWNLWSNLLHRAAGGRADVLVASADYGVALGQAMGIPFIPFDFHRAGVTISATRIRNGTDVNWEYLAPAARPHYVRRFAIVGPAQSGKTTLAVKLAQHFKTVHVPDYLATLRSIMPDGEGFPDYEKAARGQAASEESFARLANRRMFVDCNILNIAVELAQRDGSIPPGLWQLAEAQTAERALLLDPKGPGPQSPGAEECFNMLRHTLDKWGKPYKIISGDTYVEREDQAIAGIS